MGGKSEDDDGEERLHGAQGGKDDFEHGCCMYSERRYSRGCVIGDSSRQQMRSRPQLCR